jgi:hypothetical protein
MNYLTAFLGAGLLALLMVVLVIAVRFVDTEAVLRLVARLDGGDWARAMVAEVTALPPEQRRSFGRGCVRALVARRLKRPPVLACVAALLLAIFNFPWPGLIDPSASDPFHWTVGQFNDLLPMLAVGVAGWLSRSWLRVLAVAVWMAVVTGIAVFTAVAILFLMAGGDFGANPWFSIAVALPGSATTGFLVGAVGGAVGYLAASRLSAAAEPAVPLR